MERREPEYIPELTLRDRGPSGAQRNVSKQGGTARL